MVNAYLDTLSDRAVSGGGSAEVGTVSSWAVQVLVASREQPPGLLIATVRINPSKRS